MPFRVNANRRLLLDEFGNSPMVHSPKIDTRTNSEKLSLKNEVKNSYTLNNSTADYTKDLDAVKRTQEQWAGYEPVKQSEYTYKPDYSGAANKAMSSGLFKKATVTDNYVGMSNNQVAKTMGRQTRADALAGGATRSEARQLGKEAKKLTRQGLRPEAGNQAAQAGRMAGAGTAISIIGEMGKQHSLKNERFDNAAIFDYMGKGAAMGSMLGPIGTVAGTAGGLILGAIKGNKDQREFRKNKEKEAAEVNRLNAKAQADRTSALARAEERQRNAKMFTDSRNQWFKEGGKLDVPTFKITKATQLVPLKTKKEIDTNVPMFKMGGSINFTAQNVILDGPSHEEENKLMKGDKGLPIVKKGIKVAEIESAELVINKSTMDKVEDLRKKVKAGDKKAIQELGLLLKSELNDNTIDYRTLEKD